MLAAVSLRNPKLQSRNGSSMLNTEGAPLRGPESTTASTAQSDVSPNNPAVCGTYSPSYKAETEVQC